MMTFKHVQGLLLLAILAAATFAYAAGAWGRSPRAETSGFIVEARNGGAAAARKIVRSVGGQVTGELPLIDAVTAQLTQTHTMENSTPEK